MAKYFILVSLFLSVCISCGMGIFSKKVASAGEIREVQDLPDDIREEIFTRADSLMVARGEILERYVSDIAQDDLHYHVIYQGKTFKGAPTVVIDKKTLAIVGVNLGK
ncbi:MAG TPA: hypothetical protein VHP63_07505 [candidate division Zixibacteria bacterium]|nr:hypothetical protein [candidate division Zixibacteria bacterium]